MELSEILEITMILCFGISWPFNVAKSYKARTTKGKSLLFLILVLVGYIAGSISKFVKPDFSTWITHSWYVLVCYIFNLTVVSIDFALYWRNYKLDKKAGLIPSKQ